MAPTAGGLRLIRKVYRPITIERHSFSSDEVMTMSA
jgi:hypothetical protein